MNYYVTQTTYFLVFIAIAVTLYVATPVVYSTFSDTSDSYTRSQVTRIQAELLIMDNKKGVFADACDTGNIGELVQELTKENDRRVICRVDDSGSRIMVSAELLSGEFYSVDYLGFSCLGNIEPLHGFTCKEI